MSLRTLLTSTSCFLLLTFLLSACAPRIGEKQSGYIAAEDGSKIYFEKVGAGKQAVVLLPGGCTSLGIWDSIVPFLTDNYSILRFDPPGYGKSEKGSVEITPQSMGHFLFQVMDACGIRRAVLVGYASADYTLLAARAADSARIAGIISVNGFSELLTTGSDSIMASEQNGGITKGCPNDSAMWMSYSNYRNEAIDILHTMHMPIQLISSFPTGPLDARIDSLFPSGLLLYPLACRDPMPIIHCPFRLQRELRIALASIPF